MIRSESFNNLWKRNQTFKKETNIGNENKHTDTINAIES